MSVAATSRRAWRTALVLPALCLVWGAWAAGVQVQVLDGAGQPLGGAVVYLESAEARRLVKPLGVQEVSQENKQFLPAVRVLTVGTEVRFPNRDTVRHHVYSFSPAKKFELKLYTGTPAQPVLFDQPGVVVLGCNIHDHMVGWIVVLDTPYFAQTPATGGGASIGPVPPGSYRLRAWHPRLPVGTAAQEQALTVTAGGATATVRMTGLVP